ncbi:universal stress protein [Halobacteriales archaeon QH_2_65_14]|nr:MAG: universal stress protein [Halobacteriales archaeon QH_2_65_14]
MQIIVGVDGSEGGMQTLEEAVARAQAADDDLTVAVYSPEGSAADVEAAVRNRLDALGFDARIQVLDGDPGARLVDVAQREEYDRIVLSGGHVSPLGKVQVDSVIEFVLLNAHTTVTLVR